MDNNAMILPVVLSYSALSLVNFIAWKKDSVSLENEKHLSNLSKLNLKHRSHLVG